MREAEIALKKYEFSAILLDIELPDGDGLKFYSKLSQDEKLGGIPTLFITGHGDISNKLLAFSIGAEDFMTKPFDPLELNARLTSKIKKKNSDVEKRKTLRVGNLEIDFDRQKVFQIDLGKEKNLDLTYIEIRILTLLSKRLEQVYSREQILNSVWGDTNITDRTVDSHIAHLRSKIASTSVVVETVKNLGYRVVLQ